MSFLKNRILHPLFLMLSFLLAVTLAHSQKVSSTSHKFDTANLVVRICQGDLPGQKKDLSADYFPMVCAYTYNNRKLVTYTVISFELVYKDPNKGTTDIASGKGNQFTPQMKMMIIKADTAIQNLFLDNIALIDKKGQKLVVSGLRPIASSR